MRTKAQILIVEDEQITAEDIQKTLAYLGYSTSSIVASAEEAIKNVEENRPDLILMDIRLKGEMDGVEAARIIRVRFDIPVVYITGFADDVTLRRAKKTEPFGYLHKPIGEKELQTTIEIALYKHKMEKKLKESEKQYKDLVEKARIAVLIDDKKGNFKYFNKRLARLFGYSVEEMKRLSIQTLVHPEDRVRVMRFHKGCLQGKKVPSRYEFRGRRKDGSPIYLEIDAVELKEGKDIIGSRSYIWDITERKQMEDKIKKSEEEFRNIFKNANDGMIFIDKYGKILKVNKTAVQMFGGSRKELLGKHFTKIGVFPPKIIPLLLSRFKKALTRKKFIIDNLVIRDKKGQQRYLETTASPLKKDDKIIGLLVIARDVTEHKQAEEALRESEERYRLIFDGSRDAIFIAGEDSRFIEVNKAAAALTGYSKEELLKMSIPDLHEAKDLGAYKAFFQRIMNGEKITSEAPILRKDGLKIDAEFSNKRIFLRGVPCMHTVARDITERKQAEKEKERLFAQLVQSEKMAGVGTLAGGIAHEFNNLFQIIRGHTEFAQETKRAEDIEEAFNTVLYNTDKAAKIIRNLLTFSSQDPSECKSGDIVELIESVLSLTEEHFKKLNIKVVRKYGRTPRLQVNGGEMKQVFLNLLTNARDALLPEGGKLVIMVRRIKENIEVKFIDTGKGIKKKNLGKVFEPFYTTKGALGGDSKHQGTGLGLSVSYGIVKNHGGTIEVESKVGRGTIFTVKLPVKGGKAEGKNEEKSEIKEPDPLNILVADDEKDICNMFTKFLSSDGHRIKSALTGKEALNLINKEHFDIVFLDIIMPGISAIKVLEGIKEISPATKVVMMTGKLIDEDLMNTIKQKGALSVLIKPFKIDDIMKIINQEKRKSRGINYFTPEQKKS